MPRRPAFLFLLRGKIKTVIKTLNLHTLYAQLVGGGGTRGYGVYRICTRVMCDI